MVLNLAAVLLATVIGVAGPGDALRTLDRLRLTPDVASVEAVDAVLTAALAEIDAMAATRSRADKCRDAFTAGELNRLAATAVKLSADGRSRDYTDAALARYRAMRIDYLDLLEGSLGYVGEARVLRDQDDGQEALDVLAPLLEPGADPRLRRLGELEAMEALLLIDTNAAIARATTFGPGAEWVLARAHAKRGEDDAAVELARRDDVVKRTPPYDRLALIATIGVLTDAERSTWAEILVSLGQTAAARDVLEEHCPAPSAPRLATLLEADGDWREAAARWTHAATALGEPRYGFEAARCMELAGVDDQRQRREAIRLYEQVVDGAADAEVRREALRRCVGLAGADAARARLEAHPDLVDGDLYLRYARAAARRADTDADALTAELVDIERDADDALRAAALLLRAQLDPDPRGSLGLLDSNWELLTAHADVADGAQRLRAARWLDLGMIDNAADELLTDPTRHSSVALLTLADALADRAREGFGEETPTRVVRLAAAAIRQSPTSAAVAVAAARLMLAVGAAADADRVLTTLDEPAARLMRGEIALRQERPQEALDLIADLGTSEAALLRGQCLVDVGRPRDALPPIRAARGRTRNGGDLWWDATIALARAQLALGNKDAAAATIRVAEALHPVGEKRPFRSRLDDLKQEFVE